MNFRRVVDFVGELIADDSGQDLIEYAVISTVISGGGLIVMILVLVTMGVRYSTWVAQIQAAWEPGAPCGC
jgi:hypothetical protein